MKKKFSVIMLLLVFIMTVNCFASDVKMTDVDYTTELGKSIDKLVKNGVISGIPQEDGTLKYAPEQFVTRAEFCKMVNVTFGYEIAANNIFTDVNPSQWYYVHVLPAIYYGYINGYGDGRFGGEDFITREQVCTILSTIVDKPTEEKVEIKDKVSEWAKPYVENFIALGYVSLEEGGKFRATENMTRGELAFVLDDFVVVEEKPNENTSTGSGTSVIITGGIRPSGGSSNGSGSGSGNGSDNDSSASDPEPPAVEVEYTIIYELNGMGELPEGVRTSFTSSIAYALPILKGTDMYVFDGWYVDSSFSGEPFKTIPRGTTGDQTFYAKWSPRYTDEELQISQDIYDNIEFALGDMIEKEELEVFEFDEKGLIIFNHLKNCITEVVELKDTGLVVSNQYVRNKYNEQIKEITDILDGMTVEERDAFEFEINKMNTMALKDLVELFDVNINYGKE